MDILKKITGTHMGVLVGLLYFTAQFCYADNEINIEQTGDTLDLDIEQVGANNTFGMLDANSYITATNLDLQIKQYNFTGTENKIFIDELSGSGNTVKLGQGIAWDNSTAGYTYDYSEGGGHYMELDLYGDDNSLTWHQTNAGSTSGHDFNFHLAGDDNTINGRQQGNGAKELNLTIYNSDNTVTARQKGTWASHTANITLDGLYGTDLLFKQLGSTSLNYNLSVDCVTVGGCAVTVEQGQ